MVFTVTLIINIYGFFICDRGFICSDNFSVQKRIAVRKAKLFVDITCKCNHVHTVIYFDIEQHRKSQYSKNANDSTFSGNGVLCNQVHFL